MDAKTMEELEESGKLGESYLEHYGIKGMKWGQRRKRGANGRVSTEAKRTAKIQEKVKSQGLSSLTNKELGDYNKRINLEKNYKKLQPKSKIDRGHDFTKEILAIGTTINAAIAFASSPMGKKMMANFKKKS